MKKETQKTVFIILGFGMDIRNVLKTDIFSMLKSEPDIRLVIFSPLADEDFKKEYESENVIVEKVPNHRGIITRRILAIKKYVWIKKTEVLTIKIKKPKLTRIVKTRDIILGKILSAIVRNPSRLLKILNRLQLFFFRDKKAKYYFDKYKPDLVFYTTLYARDLCLEIEAQKRGIKTVCLIHSWDNPTAKGAFPVVPDKIVVWNEILKEEIAKHHEYPGKDIYVAGIPQFDIYYDKTRFMTKEQFFKKWGLDLYKKLITYATPMHGQAPFSPDIVNILYNAIKENYFSYPCQLLIRLHPRDFKERYKDFEGLNGIIIQMPGREADVKDRWNPTEEDMLTLAETMYYSDVLINVASTIAIDAVTFDTPVVCIGFDGYQEKPYLSSCRRFYDYDHIKNIVATKGVRVAYSREELLEFTNLYMKNPDVDAEGREKIREEQCWRLDGSSGRRIAEFILENLAG